MHRTHWSTIAAALVAAAVAGCADGTSTSPQLATSSLLSDALLTSAPGYENLSSSYAAGGNTATWVPSHDRGGMGGAGMGGAGMGAGLMGGGLHDDFAGAGRFGPGRGRGPFGEFELDSACVFSASTGRVTCPDVTRGGLTISRSFAFSDASGKAQAAFDSLTNTVNVRTAVSGTSTFGSRPGMGHGFGPDRGHGGPGVPVTDTVLTASSTVHSSSDQTVVGLAKGSTQRTVNGTSAGQEATTGTTTSGAFSASRVMGDTTRNLVIPVLADGPAYPVSGTVIRAMKASVTYGGKTQGTARREVITYDGSTTAKVVITQNDSTRTCTLPLPHGRLNCQ